MVPRVAGPIHPLTRTGSALGLFQKFQISETTTTLASGEAVLLYTDGVTEAWHPERDEEYGVEGLNRALVTAPATAVELLSHVESDLNAFTVGAPQQDDVTFLVVVKD